MELGPAITAMIGGNASADQVDTAVAFAAEILHNIRRLRTLGSRSQSSAASNVRPTTAIRPSPAPARKGGSGNRKLKTSKAMEHEYDEDDLEEVFIEDGAPKAKLN